MVEKSEEKYVKNALQSQQAEQKYEVENREFEQISAHVFGVESGIFAERYKRGKRGYERARAADVNAQQKLAVVFREVGKQYSRGHIAYKLAGDCTVNQRVCLHQPRKEVLYPVYACHIACKDKEKHKGKEQRIVNHFKRLSIHYKQRYGNNYKSYPIRNTAENDNYRESEKQKVNNRSPGV